MHNLSNGIAAGDIVLTAAGLTNGTTNKYTLANALTYTSGGLFKSKASAANQTTPLVDANTGMAFSPIGKNKKCVFVFAVDASGAVGVLQGQVFPADELQSAGAPLVPSGWAPFGMLKIEAGSTLVSNWQMGVSNMAGVTGVTYTFTDIMTVPARPV